MTVLLETDIKDNGIIHCSLVKYKDEDFIKRDFTEWALETFEHVKVSNLFQLKKEATEIAKSSYRGVANTVYLNESDVSFLRILVCML